MYKFNNHYFNLICAVWRHGSIWRRYIISYYLMLGIAQAILSLSPYAFGKAMNELQNFNDNNISVIIFWLILGIIIIFLSWLFQGPGRIMERKIALKIRQSFQLNCYKQLINLPLKWHQDHHTGDIITRINRSCTNLYSFAANQFEYLQNIIKFVMSIAFLLWISLPIGVASIILSLIVIAIVILFDKTLIPLYKAENEVENDVWIAMFDYINNMTTVISLRLGNLTYNNIAKRIDYIWNYFRKEIILNEIKWFTSGMLFSTIQIIILIWYIINCLRSAKTISLGIVVMIFRYQWELNEVFRDLSINYSEIVRMDTDVQSIQPILDDIKKASSLTKDTKIYWRWNNIEITNLTFNTVREAGKIQREFNKLRLKFKRCEKIAVIGLSGSGKSTLLNLLAGLYTPTTVQLKVDRVYFSSLNPIQSIAMLIPQDPEIFKNSIKFNITLGVDTALNQINYVTKIAGFSEVIDSLPHGLDTEICEKGLNLSVGQKQRLALARGLLAANASSIIIMDEPTSSVDLLTEQKIITNVINGFSETTIIMSLHRLHLLPKFDSIIMLQEGKIIAAGSVEVLLNAPGPVADLWQAYNTKI